MKRRVFCWLFVLLLFVCSFSAYGFEEAEETREANAAVERIREMYQAALDRSGRESFRGYCGAYINQLMMVYGINSEYVKGNGNQIFDNYMDLETTTGGYTVTAYSCKEYTLEEALEEISYVDEIAHNIVIGFTYSPNSEAGKKYGHCIYIDTLMNGMVYYSESYRIHNGEEYIQSGEPIVRTLEEFVTFYQHYKLDGVLYFKLPEEEKESILPEISIETGEALDILNNYSPIEKAEEDATEHGDEGEISDVSEEQERGEIVDTISRDE